MNAQRRKEITEVIGKLGDLAAEVRGLGEEEREYYDNMPESIQSGEKGERADDVAQMLEEAADSLDEVLGQLEEAAE